MNASAESLARDEARPAPDPARDHVRDLIRGEVALRRPRPIARRTVELLAESAVEPAPGVPAYRIVDRRGEPRLREVEGAPAQALTLAEFLTELAARHPALFEPPAPAAEPEPEAPAAGESAAAQAARMRDDAARYIELQSAKARIITRAVAARSTARGRNVAASAGATLAAVRGRAEAWTKRPAAPSAAQVDRAAPAATQSVPFGDRVRMRGGDVLARARDLAGQGSELLDGRWVLGAATAAAVLVAAVVLVGTAREGAETPPAGNEASGDASPRKPAAASPQISEPTPPQTQTSPQTSPTAQPDPAPETAPASSPPAQEPQTPASPQTAEDDPELPPVPGEVSGPAEVVDTATLRIGGKVLHLFGVEWVRGGQPQDLTRYLAGRSVTCQRAPGSENHLCTVEGRDLSEVVLFNGGGRASPEASPDLVAAEDHARTERLGVWKR